MGSTGSDQCTSTAFVRGNIADQVPLQLTERLKDCPTLNSFSPQWATVQQLQGPELVVFTPAAAAVAGSAVVQGNDVSTLRDWGCKARSVIDQHLVETGALLLHGLPLTTPQACETFVEGLGFNQMQYEPVGPPRQKVGRLDAATNIGQAELLDLHNEMSYNPKPPAKIMLICLQPAEEGGESLIGDGAAITAAMPQSILQRFADKGGIKYTRTYFSSDTLQKLKQEQQQQQAQMTLHNLGQHAADTTSSTSQEKNTQVQQKQPQPQPRRGPPPMSWQEKTGSSDKREAAAYFEALGFTVEWQDTPGPDTLVAWHVVPAVISHPVTQQPLWFNIAHLPFPGTTYADGTPVEKDIMDEIAAARLLATSAIKLQAGDVLVLDNYRYLHGRLPYVGSGRVLVAVLTAD